MRIMNLLIFWTVVSHINKALYQSDAFTGSNRISSAFTTWFKLLSGWTPRTAFSHKRPAPSIESSFKAEKELILASQRFNLRQYTDIGGCICISSPSCSVTCTSFESQCGRTCTHVYEFSAKLFVIANQTDVLTTTFVTSYSKGCEQVTAGCSTTAVAVAATVDAAAVAAAAAVVAIAVGVGIAVPVWSAAAVATEQSSRQENQIQEQVAKFLSTGGRGLFDNRTPQNELAIPVPGKDLQDDGCGDSSARFQDGRCYPVLKRGPCRNPYFWITVDPVKLTVSNFYVGDK